MVEKGNTVKVHYKGTLTDGTVFDSSEGREPLEFKAGAGNVIPGFDDAVVGMAVGATQTVSIPCEQAYGQPREEMIVSVPLAELPDAITPEVGMVLEMQTQGGPVPVRVTELTDDSMTIDANHPLAGQDLTFMITVVEAS